MTKAKLFNRRLWRLHKVKIIPLVLHTFHLRLMKNSSCHMIKRRKVLEIQLQLLEVCQGNTQIIWIKKIVVRIFIWLLEYLVLNLRRLKKT